MAGVSVVTVGSDSHVVDDLCVFFDKAVQRLENTGYDYYCVFEKRRSRKLYLKDVIAESRNNPK